MKVACNDQDASFAEIQAHHEAIASHPARWVIETEHLRGYSDERPARLFEGVPSPLIRNCRHCGSTLTQKFPETAEEQEEVKQCA